MGATDWAQTVVAATSVVALLFAGYQVFHLRRDHRAETDAAIRGVAVQWTCIRRPTSPEEAVEGWSYELVAANPGRLPIRDVEVRWIFDRPVQRVHWNGARDEPSQTITLLQPVILGGVQRTWKRTIVIAYTDRDALRATTAEIHFTTVDNQPHTNHMRVHASGPSRPTT